MMQLEYNTIENDIKHGNFNEIASMLDQKDTIGLRESFHIPKTLSGQDEIYLCGNSLGCQPKQTKAYILEELDKWASLGVRGHFCDELPWMPYHEFLSQSLANLVGAKPDEVVAMNTLTVNLHLLMVSFYRPTNKRYKIIIEASAFPSDQYACTSQLQYHGYSPEHLILVKPKPGQSTLELSDWQQILDEHGQQTALVLAPAVQYLSGQYFELKSLCEMSHAKGCLFGVDAAHGVGNVPLQLHDWDIDFAVWCHYKYCNSGPGAVAGAFVHQNHHQNQALPRFGGWWGHDKQTRFNMNHPFKPIPTAEGWQLSNPTIISLAMIRASLDLFEQAGGIMKLREKSLALTGLLETLIKQSCSAHVEIITPNDPMQRGAQLSLKVLNNQGRHVFEQLDTAGISVDWREPETIRVAPAPLYNTFSDVTMFVERLSECFDAK